MATLSECFSATRTRSVQAAAAAAGIVVALITFVMVVAWVHSTCNYVCVPARHCRFELYNGRCFLFWNQSGDGVAGSNNSSGGDSNSGDQTRRYCATPREWCLASGMRLEHNVTARCSVSRRRCDVHVAAWNTSALVRCMFGVEGATQRAVDLCPASVCTQARWWYACSQPQYPRPSSVVLLVVLLFAWLLGTVCAVSFCRLRGTELAARQHCSLSSSSPSASSVSDKLLGTKNP